MYFCETKFLKSPTAVCELCGFDNKNFKKINTIIEQYVHPDSTKSSALYNVNEQNYRKQFLVLTSI